MTVKLWPLTATVVCVILLLVFALSSCSNVAKSRGGPRSGQVVNAQWSATSLDVYGRDGGRTRIRPGEATPKGRRYARFCIPPGYTGSARIATDDNPTGWPPTQVSGGSCHQLTDRDIATITVNR